MAKKQSVIDFVTECCVCEPGAFWSMPEFRKACQRWAFERGDNPPTARFISRVLREVYGIEPRGKRYDWDYEGIRPRTPEEEAMTAVLQSAPPARAQRTRQHGRPWAEFASLLRGDPGEWYEVEEHGMSASGCQVYASRIRTGALAAFQPKGDFDARHKGEQIWARYIGE